MCWSSSQAFPIICSFYLILKNHFLPSSGLSNWWVQSLLICSSFYFFVYVMTIRSFNSGAQFFLTFSYKILLTVLPCIGLWFLFSWNLSRYKQSFICGAISLWQSPSSSCTNCGLVPPKRGCGCQSLIAAYERLNAESSWWCNKPQRKTLHINTWGSGQPKVWRHIIVFPLAILLISALKLTGLIAYTTYSFP